MRVIACLAGISLVALTSASFAADPAQPPTAAPAVAAADWTGFFVGTDIGYSIANTRLQAGTTADLNGFGARGASAGGFIGYNLQFDDWVAGIEVSGTVSDLNGHSEFDINDQVGGTKTSSDWSAALQARLGKLVSPDTLLFAGPGLKVFHGKGEVKANGNVLYSADDQFLGVGTITVGMETVLGGNWRARAQYDWDLLQYNNYNGLKVTPQIGTAKASLIYSFGDAAPTPEITADADRWDGIYTGVTASQNIGISTLRLADLDDSFLYDGFGASGVSGGIAAGFNFRAGDRFVLGVEADANASSLKSYYGAGDKSVGVEGANDWSLEARARAGYLASDTTLLYGFAGLSKVHSTLGVIYQGADTPYAIDFTRNGAVAGLGMETWVTDNLTLRGEYSQTFLEKWDGGLSDFNTDFSGSLTQTTQAATVGLMYHLD